MFNNIKLQFSDNVSHLGHLLSYNLNDEMDITRVIKDLNRKANCIYSLHLQVSGSTY